MPYPQQTFTPPPDLPGLLNYMNTEIVTNGRKEITAIEVNNIVNALAQFIPAYTINAMAAKVESDGGVISLSKPVSVISGTLPTSVTWAANVQKEFYIMNTFGVAINSSTYYDNLFVARTSIPQYAILHIAQMENGNWVQISNLGGISTEVANSKIDTPAITVTLSDILNRKIEATLNLSTDVGNVAEIRPTGLYVPTPAEPEGGVLGGDL